VALSLWVFDLSTGERGGGDMTVKQRGFAFFAPNAAGQLILYDDGEYSLRLELGGPVLYVRSSGPESVHGWRRNTSIDWPYMYHRLAGTTWEQREEATV